MRTTSTHQRAFTIVELIVVIAVIAALLGLLTPISRKCKATTSTVCASNLKQVALANIIWISEHEKAAPPFRVGWWDGGSSPGPVEQAKPGSSNSPPAWTTSGLADNVWFQFAWLSNELVSPKILLCPADKQGRTPAEHFGIDPNGGFLHSKFQDNAVSYLLSLDSGYPRTGAGNSVSLENASDSVLTADRNLGLQTSDNNPTCASGIRSSGEIVFPAKPSWTQQAKYGHGESGNLAFIDGSVVRSSNVGLKDFFQHDNDGGRVHLLAPR